MKNLIISLLIIALIVTAVRVEYTLSGVILPTQLLLIVIPLLVMTTLYMRGEYKNVKK